MNILASAVGLSDRDLLARLPVLATHERTAAAELVAHLAALRLRPSLYAAQGYGSLFAYCRHALRLSEDAASNRIHAARACLKFPVILELLASGELSLSAVRMLRPHLTMDNHERVLARARNGRKIDIERLVAELAPRPDVPASIRKLPVPASWGPPPAVPGPARQPVIPAVVLGTSRSMPIEIDTKATPMAPTCSPEPWTTVRGETGSRGGDAGGYTPELRPASGCPAELHAGRAASNAHSVVQPLSPERYRVQFTIGQEGYHILRRLQSLLRREIPDGDSGVIFERALRVFLEKVEAARFGTPAKRRSERRRRPEHRPAVANPDGARHDDARQDGARRDPGAIGERPTLIRPGADPGDGGHSRYIPRDVRRAVWYRDRGQCAFVAPSGLRCVEQEFLELHHIQPYALKGSATVANIALRCRRHNAYEAEVVFGSRAVSARPEGSSGAAP